ncbi:MAG TPA: glycosyltransferase family 2 protein [Thermoanaerobaculia bacterium]|jgi:glycosyltransferase involved in cell wall biosynthesis
MSAAPPRPAAASTTLSILVPAYNEERFLGALLEKILAVDVSRHAARKEIVVVDDGSSDATAAIAARAPGVRLERQPRNLGKGAAVRRAIEVATGELLLIQDADLEYEPEDYLPMLDALAATGADAVYGSRYLRGGRRPGQSWSAYLGGRALSLVGWVFTGRWLTDTVTAYKLFRAPVLRELPLATSGFELDHEITARLLARGRRIEEVPIRYRPRSRAEGKKIGLRDWLVAVRTFRRYRKG